MQRACIRHCRTTVTSSPPQAEEILHRDDNGAAKCRAQERPSWRRAQSVLLAAAPHQGWHQASEVHGRQRSKGWKENAKLARRQAPSRAQRARRCHAPPSVSEARTSETILPGLSPRGLFFFWQWGAAPLRFPVRTPRAQARKNLCPPEADGSSAFGCTVTERKCRYVCVCVYVRFALGETTSCARYP